MAELRVRRQVDDATTRGDYTAPEIPTAYDCVENCNIPPPPRRALEPTAPIPRATEGFKAADGLTEQLVALAGAAVIVGIFALFRLRK